MLPRCVGEMLRGAPSIGFGSRVDADRDQARERWIANLLAANDLFTIKPLIVVLSREPNGSVIGLISLQDDLARRLSAPGPTCHLSKKLEGALRRAKVRERKALIRQHDADEGHPRDVMPLGDHLRADQDVDLAAPQLIEHRLDAFARSGVAIESPDARLWKALLDRVLKLLRADAEVLVVIRSAFAARRRDRTMEIAVVAAERTLPAMLGQRDAASRTLGDRTAGFATYAR